MRHNISRFIIRLALFCTPFILMIGVYMACDPFKVIRTYGNFYPDEVHGAVSLNQGYVSCAVFQNGNSSHHYDSFIFGNSRSLYYPVANWTATLDTCSCAMHFSSSGESLDGLTRKVEWLDKQKAPLRNALFVVDAELLTQATTTRTSHLGMLPPQLTSPFGALMFHLQHLRVFFSPKFLRAYIDFKTSGTLKPYMTNERLLDEDRFHYDPIHNEMEFDIMENEIAQGSYYDESRLALFEGAQHPDSISPPLIGKAQMQLLQRIREVTLRHHTNVQWVISPLYNQVRLNPHDVAILTQLFGRESIHDYSGPNRWNADCHNYYETSHYRPHVAIDIIKSITE